MGRPPAADECEPVELEPLDVEPTAQRPPPRPIPRRAWVVIGVAVVVVWGAIAFATRDASHAPARAPIDSLAAGIVNLGTGRFAVVIDNQLEVIEPDRPGVHATVPLAPGPITVAAQSGDSLLVQTSDGDGLAFARPLHSELVPADRPIIAGVEPDQWWTPQSDDSLARYDNPAVGFPVGGRAVASVPRGFVVTSDGGLLTLVSANSRRPLQFGTLLASSGTLIAVRSPCSMGSCDVVVRDVFTQQAWVIPMFDTIVGAAIEPTGEHVALATDSGETLVVDVRKQQIVARLTSRNLPAPAVPFAWVPTGETLLVAQPSSVAIVQATDGYVRELPVAGVQQIFALP